MIGGIDTLDEDPSDPGDEVLTLRDFIDKEDSLIAEANFAFPGKFDKCSYSLGSINQQIYRCNSCQNEGMPPLSVCYPCSIACHSTCDLIELGRRREFRCDCGNASSNAQCLLFAEKEAQNEENDYSSPNFTGCFCVCKSLYGYAMEEVEATMYQCLACQDWLHEQCIIGLPDPNSFDDFICNACVEKTVLFSKLSAALSDASCISKVEESTSKQIFLKENWRSTLCQCESCLHLYRPYPYIANEPIMWEPEVETEYSLDLRSVLNDKVLLDTGLAGYATFRDKLKVFLESKNGSEVITKADIESFATVLRSKK